MWAPLGKEDVWTTRKCQALLDFTAWCYGGLHDQGGVATRFDLSGGRFDGAGSLVSGATMPVKT